MHPEYQLAPDDAIQLDELGKSYGVRRAKERRGFLRSLSSRIEDTGDDVGDDDEDVEEEPAEDEERAPHGDRLWALQDVSATIGRGIGLGLVGPSGAGKTTLLRLLARITLPTSGTALVRGRVVPLLETTPALFRADLDVKRNVYVLADLFGVPREVAARRMADIVGWAGLEDMADVSLRALSSGLRRRLALSTALHLEPDVLLVDEGAVGGEAAFAARVVERLRDERSAGMTLVLASHELGLIRLLCDQVMHLSDGRVIELGPTVDVLDRYAPPVREGKSKPGPKIRPRENEHVAIRSVSVHEPNGTLVQSAADKAGVILRVEVEVRTVGTSVRFATGVDSATATGVLLIQQTPTIFDDTGVYVASVVVAGGMLTAGSHYVGSAGLVVEQEGRKSKLSLEQAFELVVTGEAPTEPPSPAPRHLTDGAGKGTLRLDDAEWVVEQVSVDQAAVRS